MPNGMYGGVRGERKSPLLDRKCARLSDGKIRRRVCKKKMTKKVVISY